MNIIDMLKKAFPKPRIPQKRYLIMIGMALYYVAKLYTDSTPTPLDDAALEHLMAFISNCEASD